jgi:glycolate oxidase FAD binding subunit
MSSIAGFLANKLSKRQVVDGSRAEAWAVCNRFPHAVVSPENETQVAQVLNLASAEGWSCVPSGKGTWLKGGHPPNAVDVVINMADMDHVSAYEPDDLFITTETGLGLDLLSRYVLDGGQWLPLDPPGVKRGSIGATISTASAGPLQAGFGRPKDHILGATLATGDGRLLRLGGKVVKNVAGFDLLKLAIGSWGTLGVLTSVTVRLHPAPVLDRTLLFQGTDVSSAARLANAIVGSRVSFAAVEVIAPGEREDKDGYSTPFVAVRILEPISVAEESTRIMCEQVDATPFKCLEGQDSQLIFDDIQTMEDGAEMVLRLSLLPSKLPSLIEKAKELGELADPNVGWGTRMAAHASTGVLRVMIDCLHRRKGWLEMLTSSLSNFRCSLESEGGSMVVSQGPPEVVEIVGAWGKLGPVTELMRGLQKEFDPASILAPERIIG